MGLTRAIAGLLTAVVLFAPSIVDAQPTPKTSRLGVLEWDQCPGRGSVLATALQALGHTWDQRLDVVCRSADRDYGRLAEAASALAAAKVDVIVALTHITAYAARRATSSTPIIMIASGDPVRSGLVSSLARPGGNVTGLTYYSTELAAKRLQLLKEMLPGVARVAVLGNPQSDHVFGVYRRDTEDAANTLGVELLPHDVSDPRDLDRTFERAVAGGAQALLVLTDPMLRDQARRLAELAAQHRLPAMYWGPWFVEAGGLAAYSADYAAMIRRAAYYVDRVLKGTRPGDLPVEQPTRFELLINMKAARGIGLTIPASVLARADRLID